MKLVSVALPPATPAVLLICCPSAPPIAAEAVVPYLWQREKVARGQFCPLAAGIELSEAFGIWNIRKNWDERFPCGIWPSSSSALWRLSFLNSTFRCLVTVFARQLVIRICWVYQMLIWDCVDVPYTWKLRDGSMDAGYGKFYYLLWQQNLQNLIVKATARTSLNCKLWLHIISNTYVGHGWYSVVMADTVCSQKILNGLKIQN